MKLYEITNQWEELLKDISFDASEISNEEFNTKLNEIKSSFEDKAIAVGKYIHNLEAEAEMVLSAIKPMKERADRLNRQATNLRNYLGFNIESTGLVDKIKCPEFEIYFKLNPAAVIILDESLIPEPYLKRLETISVDKKAIKKDIDDGLEVEGAYLQRKKVLVIK